MGPLSQKRHRQNRKGTTRAARFICRDYRSRAPGSITGMLRDLDLRSLQERRRGLRLTFLFRVVEGMVPAMPVSKFLEPVGRDKRRVRLPPRYRSVDFESGSATVASLQTNHNQCFKTIQCKTATYQNSFFPKTVPEWNQLNEHIIDSPTVRVF